MEVWITRDAANVGGAIRAWSENPKWNGAVWYSEERPTTTAVWRWPSLTFHNDFGFLPDFGTCRKAIMRLDQQPADATERERDMISQLELCGVILLWLDEQGVDVVSPRQTCVIAKAATEIIEALKEPEREEATP